MPPAPFFQKGVVQNVHTIWLIFTMILRISWFLAGHHGSYGMCSVILTLCCGCKPYFPSRYPYHETKVCFPHFISSHISLASSIVLKLLTHSHAYITERMWFIGSMFMADNQMEQLGNVTILDQVILCLADWRDTACYRCVYLCTWTSKYRSETTIKSSLLIDVIRHVIDVCTYARERLTIEARPRSSHHCIHIWFIFCSYDPIHFRDRHRTVAVVILIKALKAQRINLLYSNWVVVDMCGLKCDAMGYLWILVWCNGRHIRSKYTKHHLFLHVSAAVI